MLKNNKWKLVLSSILTVLPAIAAVIFRGFLTEKMITGWNNSNTAWPTEIKMLCIMPVIMLVLQWICLLITACDNRRTEQNGKVVSMVIWLMPVISIYSSFVMCFAMMGWDFDICAVTLMLMGILFIVIGNYLPKTRYNRTIGIKILWTLASEENWIATHRFTGKIWFGSGFIMIVAIFLPDVWGLAASAVVIILAMLLSVIYSYWYYKKQIASGAEIELGRYMGKRGKLASCAVSAIIAAIIVIIFLTANVEIIFEEEYLRIEATYCQDIELKYEDIESVEFRNEFDIGRRFSGYGSFNLSMGNFRNDEFGSYTVYVYNSCESVVVIRANGKILVINGEDEASTMDIYETLTAK